MPTVACGSAVLSQPVDPRLDRSLPTRVRRAEARRLRADSRARAGRPEPERPGRCAAKNSNSTKNSSSSTKRPAIRYESGSSALPSQLCLLGLTACSLRCCAGAEMIKVGCGEGPTDGFYLPLPAALHFPAVPTAPWSLKRRSFAAEPGCGTTSHRRFVIASPPFIGALHHCRFAVASPSFTVAPPPPLAAPQACCRTSSSPRCRGRPDGSRRRPTTMRSPRWFLDPVSLYISVHFFFAFLSCVSRLVSRVSCLLSPFSSLLSPR